MDFGIRYTQVQMLVSATSFLSCVILGRSLIISKYRKHLPHMICRFSPQQAPTPLLVTMFHVISLHSLPQTCRAHSPTFHFLFPLCGRPGYSQMGPVLSFRSLLACYLLTGSSLSTHSGAPPPTLPDALPTFHFLSSLTLNMICNCLV